MSSSQELSSDSTKQEVLDFGIYYLDIVQCPLDPNHKLRRHRLPYHILKCRKNFPDKQPCPFGHYFYADKNDMANHLKECSHKPRFAQAEERQPHILEPRRVRNANIVYNYDVENYEIDEPYWD